MFLEQITLSDIIAIASLVASGFTVVKVFFSVAQKIAEIEVKVDTMWMFTLRRGQSEAIVDKLMKQNSPLVVTEKAYEIIKPILPELQVLYKEVCATKPDIDDASLALIIEQRLGDRILQEICIPYGLYLGACLVIAVEAAKGTWNGHSKNYQPCE